MFRMFCKVKINFILLLSVIWILPLKAYAQEPLRAESVFSNNIERILANSCLRKKKFGIKIHSLEKDETLYSVRSDRLYAPASNVKVLTTAVALKRLGSQYQFKTNLYATLPMIGGVLKSDLYIKGFGDPSLVSEQMWLLVNELKALNLNKVDGDIVADGSFFDNSLRIKTWKKAGVEAYNAPLSALSFNFNTVAVHVFPGERLGDRPRVVVDPDIDFIQVGNRAKTVSKSQRSRLIVNRVDRGNN